MLAAIGFVDSEYALVYAPLVNVNTDLAVTVVVDGCSFKTFFVLAPA